VYDEATKKRVTVQAVSHEEAARKFARQDDRKGLYRLRVTQGGVTKAVELHWCHYGR
jgi:hypothetical protein